MAKISQADRVLAYMKAGGTLTSLEALKLFGIISFPKRICELEKRGFKFKRTSEPFTNEYGKGYYLRYELDGN